TPAYMAPEQAEGKANLVGPRSDVYSLGAILYEMLAGRPPFVGENALQVMRAALHEEPVPPRVFTPGVPRDLETICLKCLEKEPARRYTSAAEFAEDLKAFQHDEPISARPIGAVERAWKKVRKNPAPYLVAAVAMVVIVAGTAVFMWSLDQKRRDALAQKQIAEGERANALAQKQIAEQREVQAEKARKGAEERQAESLAAQGDALGLAGRWPEAEARYKEAYELFTKLGLSTLPADLGMMDRYRHSPVPLMTIKGKGGGISSVALTPDGRQVLAGGANGQLVLWDVLTGREVRSLKGHQGNVNSVAVSPDGKVALSGGDDKMMRLWDMATGAEVQSFGHPTTKVCRVAFSPNGSLAIAGYGSGPCEIWDVKSGSRIHTLAGPTDGHMRVAFSPNGTKVLSGAWCNRPNNVSLYDVATGQSVCSMDGGFNTNAVAYSPDGSTVLAATARGTFRLWDTTTGRTLPALPSHAGSVECAVFLPDGSAVLAAGSEGILKLTETATRTATKSFFGHGDCVRSVACAEDGRHAVTGSDDGTVRVWPLTNGRDHRVVVVSADNSHSAALSPDGYLAAYPEWLNVRLTDAATGRRLRLLRAHAKNVTLALFSPDSRVLASGGDDFEVIFWSVTDGAQISKSGKLGGEPFSIAFSRDGRLALFGGFRMPAAGLVEIESARRLHSFHVDDVPWGLAFAPDGRTALVGDGGGSVTLWDVTTGLARPSFASKGSSGVGAAAFSPDGRTFITGHYDKTIRLWDASTGQVTQTFRGHTNAVKSVLFFADGKLAVSGSWDNTIKLWHVGSGREMHTFLGHTANIVTVSLSQDGKTMLSAGHDRRLRFWDLSAAHRYREFLPRVEQAIAALQDKPDDAAALATLAEWYYFRNFPDWAAELWERARAAGAKVLSLELARAYWMSDKPAEAKREFLKALEAKESPEYYLKLCLEAVDSKEK
ncbi:MAG: protein kinase, partial [Planctomycetota bacterium]|nr:protein kinase [Planctomycetota bacterium]